VTHEFKVGPIWWADFLIHCLKGNFEFTITEYSKPFSPVKIYDIFLFFISRFVGKSWILLVYYGIKYLKRGFNDRKTVPLEDERFLTYKISLEIYSPRYVYVQNSRACPPTPPWPMGGNVIVFYNQLFPPERIIYINSTFMCKYRPYITEYTRVH